MRWTLIGVALPFNAVSFPGLGILEALKKGIDVYIAAY